MLILRYNSCCSRNFDFQRIVNDDKEKPWTTYQIAQNVTQSMSTKTVPYWFAQNPAEVAEVEEGLVAIDANGNKLADGDTVTLIKDLKVKGAPKDLKQGTRVKNIRIVEGDHNIDCKIDGFGAMKLKSEFVKKI